ncbi:arginase [Luteibaculum oceani]|uniref:Arginase n=1 Tax=Luteibaculum oceani TaxID=1294296 RepID=A0A5C6VAY3_9FLAO|nr:arginase [Luteibaculum oceani]TXC81731.1 arginase [Luteibaculum oceani]
MRKLKIIEVPCDLGAGTRGASLGVDALRLEAVEQACSSYLETEYERVTADNTMLNQPDPTPNAHYLKGIVKFYEHACEAISKTLDSGKFPLIIAGDHSTAGGSIAGIKKHIGEKRLGVIWVDAHADIHSPYTTPSGNVHGMPLGAALHFDNKEQQINDLNPEETTQWEKLKNVGGKQPKIKADDIIYMGVRDTEEQEDIIVEKLSIPNLTVSGCRKIGIENSAKTALDKLSHCDAIYISFDVDSMDPSVSMGTGTPVKNGYTKDEATTLLKTLLNSPKVCALEIVEINPMLDNENKMAKASLDILRGLFSWN